MERERLIDSAAEEREREKREAEEWWKKVLAYYMMEGYVKEREAAQKEADEKLSIALALFAGTGQYIKKRDLWSLLFQKPEKGLSGMELLEDIGKDVPADSAFGTLLARVKDEKPSERDLNDALHRVITEEPPRMIEAAKEERKRRAERQRDGAEGGGNGKAGNAWNAELVGKQLAFLRLVMPPELYRELANTLKRENVLDEESLGVRQERQKQSYSQYVEQRRIDPKIEIREEAGRLANLGDVYTAAAYMLAAYEQRDARDFDAEKADARAMELSGSRAFRAYMDGHPGSLIAAARNTGVESTHDDIVALDAELKRRDAVLTDARDNLKRMAAGKTPCFHQMLNALNRFVNADAEPTQQEKASLVQVLGQYLTTDCAPNSLEADKLCFVQAMRSVKALVPENEFARAIERVNMGREPKVKAEDFDVGVSPKRPEAEIKAPKNEIKRETPGCKK